MIQELHLHNYKCFADQRISFKALTLLSGFNDTGKSSVIQSLLLLRQSYQQDLFLDRGLVLNGDLVNVGTVEDVLFEKATEDMITFQLGLKNGHEQAWRFLYDRKTDALSLDISNTQDKQIYHSSLFNNNFHYLTAERIGPRPFFNMSDILVRHRRQLGSAGEYAAHFLYIYGDEIKVHTDLAHPDATSLDLKNQVDAWLGEINPNTCISVVSNAETDTIGLQYAFVDKGSNRIYRARTVGFGITYALPILVAVLSSQPGALVLIENPEAHLHPKGQSQMVKLLTRAAHCGVQIVLETHSDHILNGTRVAVHDGELAPEDVQIHFFQRQKDGQAQVLSPRIDRNGRIDAWPDGFFDEWDKNLELLLLPGNMQRVGI
jgi:predicted ATPase